MTIKVEALTFDVIIGIFDFEREKPQRVIVDMEATYLYKEGVFINYADVAGKIEEKLKTERYDLLEEALIGLEELLHKHYPQITKLTISLAKPDILNNCSVSLKESWIY